MGHKKQGNLEEMIAVCRARAKRLEALQAQTDMAKPKRQTQAERQETIRREAFGKGYQAGLVAGFADGLAEVDEECSSLMAAVRHSERLAGLTAHFSNASATSSTPRASTNGATRRDHGNTNAQTSIVPIGGTSPPSVTGLG